MPPPAGSRLPEGVLTARLMRLSGLSSSTWNWSFQSIWKRPRPKPGVPRDALASASMDRAGQYRPGGGGENARRKRPARASGAEEAVASVKSVAAASSQIGAASGEIAGSGWRSGPHLLTSGREG